MVLEGRVRRRITTPGRQVQDASNDAGLGALAAVGHGIHRTSGAAAVILHAIRRTCSSRPARRAVDSTVAA